MRFVSVVGAASCMVVEGGVQARRVGIGHWRMGGARTTVALRSGAPIQGVRNTTRAVDTALVAASQVAAVVSALRGHLGPH